MGEPWRSFTLDEVVAEILDRRGVTPSKLGSEFKSSGHRMISAKVIKEQRVDLDADEPRYVDGATFRRWMRTPLQRGDVLLTSEAPLGEVAWLPADVDWCLGQRLFGLRFKSDVAVGRFVALALQTGATRADLLARASGTTAQGIRQSELRKVRVSLPSVCEQDAVAEALGAIGDRIEVNRRMAATLEEVARALFKSWFVDFDPVRAKAEGRDPGLPSEIADLFPDRFDESPLGPIPFGWGVRTIGELASIERGLSYTGAGLSDGVEGVPMINLGCFSGGGRTNWGKIKRYQGAFRLRHLVRPGDLLVANTDMTQNRVILGSPARVPSNAGDDAYLFSHHTYVVRPSSDPGPATTFLYHSLLHPRFREVAEGYATGTTVLAMPKNAIENYPVAVPIEPLLALLHERDTAIHARVEVLTAEAASLSRLRDQLLPKLVSGEIRIADPEDFLAQMEAVG